MNIIYVAIGAAAGGVLRYLMSLLIPPAAGSFPWATFVVNVAGSFIVGIVLYLSAEQGTMSESTRLLIGVGFCGGLTTFSTFSAETLQLVRMKDEALAFAYIGASLVTCIAATYCGLVAIRTLVKY